MLLYNKKQSFQAGGKAPVKADTTFWQVPTNRAQTNVTDHILRPNYYTPPVKKKTPYHPVINIKDSRKILLTTNGPIRPNVDKVGGTLDTTRLGELLTEAKRNGLGKSDMMNLAAMAYQETKAGKTDPNIGHVINAMPGEYNKAFIDAYKAKMAEADRLGIKDQDRRLQVYNGNGKIFPNTEKAYHGFTMKKIYGVTVPKEGLDLRKNPLYGKQVRDIRDNVLAKNPRYVRYMDSIAKAPVTYERNPFTGDELM